MKRSLDSIQLSFEKKGSLSFLFLPSIPFHPFNSFLFIVGRAKVSLRERERALGKMAGVFICERLTEPEIMSTEIEVRAIESQPHNGGR